MIFTGPRTKLSDTDLPRLGHEIGVGEDEVHAFLEVEARGSGFDGIGRPAMLFEPHIFYGLLSGAKLARAVAAGVAYPTWGQRPYPADSYPRLHIAMAIDEEAALRSASWGIGQVLGTNFRAAGYASAKMMVNAFVDGGEPEQLAAAVRFIKFNGLDRHLRAHNWAAFARGYNGVLYARNAYDTKLAAAYTKWSRIPDTPWKPGASPRVTVADTLKAALASSGTTMADAILPEEGADPEKERNERAQQRLKDLGYKMVGEIDGKVGARTKAALTAFRDVNGLPIADGLDDATEDRLFSDDAIPMPIPPERAEATAADLAPKSPIIRKAERSEVAATVATAAPVAGGALYYLGQAVTALQPVKDFLAAVPVWVWVAALAAVAGYLWWQARHIRNARVEMHRQGETA